MVAGRPRSSKLGMVLLTRRATRRSLPRCLEQVDAEAALVVADDVGEVDAAFVVEDLPLSWSSRSGQHQPSPCLLGERPACSSAG